MFGGPEPQTIAYLLMLRAGRKGASGTQGDRGTARSHSMKHGAGDLNPESWRLSSTKTGDPDHFNSEAIHPIHLQLRRKT